MDLRILFLALLIPVVMLRGQDLDGQAADPASGSIHSEDTLPIDPAIIRGRLENGLSYYVRENRKPENRAQVWLAVNAGSVLEDEDQRGLAHFLEHMAFNGTEDFAKHEIIDYLESIGMQFGPEINAYTGFDETVYTLQLPTDSAEVLETGFEILYQWAHKISFEAEEIEKERGVVIEEWRMGRGAQMRMLLKQLPVIFRGSRYMDRLPIGSMDILKTFKRESLIRFYRDWYRPDLMAVIAVGDFESERVLELIREKFSEIPAVDNARIRKDYPVPDHRETLFAIATDNEATSTGISIYYKSDPLPQITVNDYRRMIIEHLFTRMLNIRLYELLNQAEPPYLHAYVSKNDLVRTKSIYSLNVTVREDGIGGGLEAALTEAIRVRRHGFTGSELERTKTWLIRRMERAYQEREKTESSGFASEYLRNFLENEPVPGIAFEYEAMKKLLPGISLEEVNLQAENWLGENNRVVLVNAPEKEGLEIPDEHALESLLSSVEQKEIPPYEDLASGKALLEDLPTGAAIVSESCLEDIGVSLWELSNGIKILLKPTDFKNDEILFQGFSPGGNSLVPDEMYRSSRAAPEIISLSGVGEFDLNSLNKKMTGKVVSVFPYIDELSEGIIGSASPRDQETMFQLVYLYITRPRKDSSAYLSYKTRMQGVIENRFSDPESAFYDTLMVTLADYHFRRRPWSMEMLEEIDPEDSYRIYVDRFADAGDFTFVVVGSFHPDSIRPLVKTYLGSLPSTGRTESWKDINIRPPEGIIKKTIERGIEPKSRESLNFTGDYEWTRENNYAINSMASVLRIKLREILREDLSGTYGANVSVSTLKYPKESYRISISFGCAPERTGELTSTVFAVIDSLKNYPVDPSYITKISETQKRSFETSLEQNRFWLSNLVRYAFMGQDPRLIMEYPELVNSLDTGMIRDAARRYFDTDNYIQVILKPEQDVN